MSQSIEEALVPPEAKVAIGGKSYPVKRLTLKQLIQVGTLAGKLSSDVRERILEQTNAGAPDMVAILGALRDEDMAQLLSVLLRAGEPEDLKRFSDASIEEVSELAVALTEVNNFEKVVSNFQKAMGNARGLKQTLSPSSSER